MGSQFSSARDADEEQDNVVPVGALVVQPFRDIYPFDIEQKLFDYYIIPRIAKLLAMTAEKVEWALRYARVYGDIDSLAELVDSPADSTKTLKLDQKNVAISVSKILQDARSGEAKAIAFGEGDANTTYEYFAYLVPFVRKYANYVDDDVLSVQEYLRTLGIDNFRALDKYWSLFWKRDGSFETWKSNIIAGDKAKAEAYRKLRLGETQTPQFIFENLVIPTKKRAHEALRDINKMEVEYTAENEEFFDKFKERLIELARSQISIEQFIYFYKLRSRAGRKRLMFNLRNKIGMSENEQKLWKETRLNESTVLAELEKEKVGYTPPALTEEQRSTLNKARKEALERNKELRQMHLEDKIDTLEENDNIRDLMMRNYATIVREFGATNVEQEELKSKLQSILRDQNRRLAKAAGQLYYTEHKQMDCDEKFDIILAELQKINRQARAKSKAKTTVG